MSVNTVTTVNISIELVRHIFLMTKTNIIDKALWKHILLKMLTDKEHIKFNLVLNILNSPVEYNIDSLVKSCGPIITIVMAAIQALFGTMNVEQTQQKLLEWMESNNENEGEYLKAANLVKSINTAIESFNKQSKQQKGLNKCRFYLDSKHNVLMVACEF